MRDIDLKKLQFQCDNKDLGEQFRLPGYYLVHIVSQSCQQTIAFRADRWIVNQHNIYGWICAQEIWSSFHDL